MAEDATLARPYARAAFEFAQDAKALAGWGELLATAAVVAADDRFAALIGNPKLGPAELADFVLDIVGDIAGDTAAEPGRNFIRLLAQNQRLGLLPQIAAQYAQLRADVENTADVEVVSAFALTAEQSGKLTRALTRRLQRSVRLHASVDASLIGGAIVRAGDLVIDGSLRGRLERLAQAMTN